MLSFEGAVSKDADRRLHAQLHCVSFPSLSLAGCRGSSAGWVGYKLSSVPSAETLPVCLTRYLTSSPPSSSLSTSFGIPQEEEKKTPVIPRHEAIPSKSRLILYFIRSGSNIRHDEEAFVREHQEEVYLALCLGASQADEHHRA